MGIVYEAEHESLKNRVALKVMHPRFRADRAYLRRFQTEARSAAKLHHTNIVPVFDYGEQDGVCYYAMQYIDGVGLERVLEDVRRLRAAASRDTEAGMGGAGQGTVIDARTDPLTGISLGLLTGGFADASTAPLVAGSDATDDRDERRRRRPEPTDWPRPPPVAERSRVATRSPVNPSRFTSARSPA